MLTATVVIYAIALARRPADEHIKLAALNPSEPRNLLKIQFLYRSSDKLGAIVRSYERLAVSRLDVRTQQNIETCLSKALAQAASSTKKVNDRPPA